MASQRSSGFARVSRCRTMCLDPARSRPRCNRRAGIPVGCSGALCANSSAHIHRDGAHATDCAGPRFRHSDGSKAGIPGGLGAVAGPAGRRWCLGPVRVPFSRGLWRRHAGGSSRGTRAASTILIGGATPVLAYGLYAVAHGGLLLPNSVIMKSMPERFASLGTVVTGVAGDWGAASSLASRPALMFLVAAVVLALLLQSRTSARAGRPSVWVGSLFVGAAMLHVALVKMDWFFRYDAYLMALGILALVALRPTLNVRTAMPTMVPAVAVLTVLFAQRGLPALYATPAAAGNVYDQQTQMARMFAAHYPGRVVAVNDIGLVAWAGRARVLDLAGLASSEVARLRRSRQWNTASMAEVVGAADVSVVCVYGAPFFDMPAYPSSWVPLGTWTIKNNVAVAYDTVTFLAPRADRADAARCALESFSRTLPPAVRVNYSAVAPGSCR